MDDEHYVSQFLEQVLDVEPHMLSSGSIVREILVIPTDKREAFLNHGKVKLSIKNEPFQKKKKSSPGYVYTCVKNLVKDYLAVDTIDCISSSSKSCSQQQSEIEYLFQVQQCLEIPSSVFDSMNQSEILSIEPKYRHYFLCKETIRLKNSPSFKKNRANSRYVYQCIKNAKERMRTNYTHEDDYDKTHNEQRIMPTRGYVSNRKLLPIFEKNTWADALANKVMDRAQDISQNHENSRDNSETKAATVEKYDFHNLTETKSEDKSPGRMQIFNHQESNDEAGEEIVWIGDMNDGRKNLAKLQKHLGLHPSSLKELLPCSTQPRSVPLLYPLQFTIAMIRNRLSEESLSYLNSIPKEEKESEHAFQVEKFCLWLWENSVVTTDKTILEKENLEREYHQCQQLDIPWFEREEESLPLSDDVLRQRCSYLQFVAKLGVDEQGGRVVLHPIELRKERKSNRVLRHFWKYRDRFLIVQVDDSLKKTRKQKQTLQDALKDGQTLCGRKFNFLYDHDGRVHMFAPLGCEDGPKEMKSCIALLNWIGDLSLVPRSKQCDRISLAFTPTCFIVSLHKDQIKVQDDIKSKCGKFCFTDGIGSYGLDVQEIVVGQRQHLCGGYDRVCAMQVRIAAAKGMLVLDPLIKGVILRKSMIKFRCSRLELEVVEVNYSATVDTEGESKIGNLSLNVELIQLLEHNGVSLHILHQILNDQLEKLRATFDFSSAPAMLKRKLEVGKDIPLKEADHINFALACGLDTTLFPVRDWIENLLKQEVNKLKKLRIPIEGGASNLFGVTLENSGLKPNQVYVKLSPFQKPLQGHMLVGRHPCNHPGDIQLVEAVSGVVCNRRLGHLHGVLVFSSEGERPIPDMTGGGDLDGDKFFIIFDPRLLCSTVPPFDYGSYNPKSFDFASLGLGNNTVSSGALSDVDYQSLIEEFVRFHDNVGELTNLRRVAADKFGAGDSRTIQLCGLVSRALDAKANGDRVSVPDVLKVDGKPIWWKKENQNFDYIYSPNTAVGKAASALFTAVDNFEFLLEPIKADVHLEAPILATDLTSDQIVDYERKAHDIVEEYFSKKQNIVNEKKIDSKRTKILKRNFRDKQVENHDRWDKEFRLLNNEISRKIISPSFGSGGYSSEECMRRVSAIYWYCWNNRRMKNKSTTILQIPLVLQYLIRIKKDAVDAEIIEQGNLPNIPLLLTQPGEYVVLRKKDAKLL